MTVADKDSGSSLARGGPSCGSHRRSPTTFHRAQPLGSSSPWQKCASLSSVNRVHLCTALGTFHQSHVRLLRVFFSMERLQRSVPDDRGRLKTTVVGHRLLGCSPRRSGRVLRDRSRNGASCGPMAPAGSRCSPRTQECSAALVAAFVFAWVVKLWGCSQDQFVRILSFWSRHDVLLVVVFLGTWERLALAASVCMIDSTTLRAE